MPAIDNESILTSIKKLLQIDEMYEAYDADIMIHINTFLTRVNQLGIGKRNFYIYDKSATWKDFLGDTEAIRYQQAKDYVYLKIRLIFDPPQNSATIKAFEDNAKMLEWMLYVTRNNKDLLDSEEEEDPDPTDYVFYKTSDGRLYQCADGRLYALREE